VTLWDVLAGPDSEANAREGINDAIRGRFKANLKVSCYRPLPTDSGLADRARKAEYSSAADGSVKLAQLEVHLCPTIATSEPHDTICFLTQVRSDF
jgi:hypothetical protein